MERLGYYHNFPKLWRYVVMWMQQDAFWKVMSLVNWCCLH